MKKLFSLLLAATAALAFTAAPADARGRDCDTRHHHRSHHRLSYGAPRYCEPREYRPRYCPPVYCPPAYCPPQYYAPVRPACGYGYYGEPGIRFSFGFGGRPCRW